jgi:hypothetical protein
MRIREAPKIYGSYGSGSGCGSGSATLLLHGNNRFSCSFCNIYCHVCRLFLLNFTKRNFPFLLFFSPSHVCVDKMLTLATLLSLWQTILEKQFLVWMGKQKTIGINKRISNAPVDVRLFNLVFISPPK